MRVIMESDSWSPQVALDRALQRAVRSDVLLYESVFRQRTRVFAWPRTGEPSGLPTRTGG
jgi:hypothetical protein